MTGKNVFIRSILVAAFVAVLPTSSALAQATSVIVQLFPLTGEIRIQNRNSMPFSFVQYSLKSPSGALNGTPGVWRSIADNYDASGNDFIDSVGEWNKTTLGPVASATELAEFAFQGSIGSLAPQRTISLGMIWDPNEAHPHDIVAEFGLPSPQPPVFGTVKGNAIDGDYNESETVEVGDYDSWKNLFGLPLYVADGNLDGIIDAADYTVWRDNLGATLAGTAFAEGSGGGQFSLAVSVVPEPSGLLLAMLAGTGLALRRDSPRRCVS